MSEHRKAPEYSPTGRIRPKRIPQPPTPETTDPPTLGSPALSGLETASTYSRFLGSRVGRSALAVMLVAGGASVLHEDNPTPKTQHVANATVPHTIYHTDGQGLRLREDSPTGPVLEVMPEGSVMEVDCFTIDVPVNGNPVWLHGSHDGTYGIAADYYVDTHWDKVQNLVDQGIEECGTSPALPAPVEQQPQQEVPAQKSCYFNFKWPKTNLTFSYEGEHRYYGNAWQAAKNWSDLNAGITIKPAPEGEEGDIVFKDEYFDDSVWYGEADVNRYDMDRSRGYTSQQNPQNPSRATIFVNQYGIEDVNIANHPDFDFHGKTNEELRLDDKGRTYTLTHELGHVLGLAHEEACGIDENTIQSVMESGGSEAVRDKPFNTPQEYDRIALRGLYGIHGVDNVLGNYA